MAHPFHHALSSVRKFGGKPEDYQRIHDWFDASKEIIADFRHRALRHHAQGIFECEREFGTTIRNSDGKHVPVRLIGEQHVKEDFAGRIPSFADWVRAIRPERWMGTTAKLDTEVVLERLAEPLVTGEKLRVRLERLVELQAVGEQLEEKSDEGSA
jgi:hypothetical protein